MSGLFGAIPRRSRIALAALAVALLIFPLVASSYALSVLIVILYFAYVGQAWNLMMGFGGQLSLGNALYVGLGAYVSAGLFLYLDVPPLVGFLASMGVAAAAAAAIGALAFRFGIGGVYFALLTIAFAEFTRILFAHIDFLGGNGGLFLPVANRDTNDLIELSGSPTMFYYVILTLAAAALVLVGALMRSRSGYYWLAICEDQEAARSLGINVFREKLLLVTVGGGMTSLGGVFLAFYYNNLFPADVFGMHRSIEIILAPIIGGLGTFFGPLLGAFVLGLLGEGATNLLAGAGVEAAGAKPLLNALILLLIIKFLPGGLWPWIAARTGLGR